MKATFSKISEVGLSPLDETRIHLTFDVDWVCDEVLADTIDLVEEAEVAATWFVTHDTPLLSRLRENPKFELGIHPNFNFLLMGDSTNGSTAEEVVDRLMEIVPEARSVRSHSVTQSSRLLQLFVDKGLTHDSNDFIPERSKISILPWQLWNGLIKVPYFWSDELACIWQSITGLNELITRPGLKVFDFHPIHVFLNTENIVRYEQTRTIHHKPQELIKYRHTGDGIRSMLLVLLHGK